ncbi:Heterogeneous nuclear ribonucleoprotein F [Aphelenchoides besseyi]|nr:Heterogeneous nuclear ribonucleoprotein F [Aphelenchoides besseyi]KAI6198997.1 Heterogeneous nuclear ribonucleoprotein F [Aphelenchoides besseyi]
MGSSWDDINSFEGRFVHLQGLPYSANAKEVKEFLGDEIAYSHIHVVSNMYGDAYVYIKSMDDVGKLMLKNNQLINKRYIRLRIVDNRYKVESILKMIRIRKAYGECYAVRIRGLPYECTEADLRMFFEDLNVEEIVFATDPKVWEKHRGEGYVRFATAEDLRQALLYHRRNLKYRYLEIYETDAFFEYKFKMLGYVLNEPRPLVDVVQNPKSIQPIFGPRNDQSQQADTYENEYDNYYPEETDWYDENEQPGPSGFQPNKENHVVGQQEDEFEDEDDVVDENEEPNVSISGYDILYEILRNDRAYSEKMAVIAQQLYLTAMTRAHTNGYNNFNDLDAEVRDFTGVSGSKLSELMGYPSFQAMCLNSMEIVERFTWKRKKTEVCGRTVYKISNFAPIVSGPQQILYEMQILRLREQETDPIKKYVQELCNKNDFPTDEELAFRFRFCQTLDTCNAMNQALHHSALLEAHEKLHNERLNESTYRKAFPSFKTRIDVQRIVKARMYMEITLRPTISQIDPNIPSTSSEILKSDNLEFLLRQPLAFISKCYKEVAKAREENAKQRKNRNQKTLMMKASSEESNHNSENLIINDFKSF